MERIKVDNFKLYKLTLIFNNLLYKIKYLFKTTKLELVQMLNFIKLLFERK